MTLALVVFSGLPGTGKSTLAAAVGARRGMPVLRVDDVLASAGSFIPPHPHGPIAAAELLLTNLADRYLDAGHSVILDSIAAEAETRAEWREMAEIYAAHLRVIVCICSDPALHRARLAARGRHLSAEDDAVWRNVEALRARFAPWGPGALIVDAVRPVTDNLRDVLAHLETTSCGDQ